MSVFDPAPPAAAAEPGKVRFGDRPTQVIPVEWAEHIFRAMCATESGRKKFGDMMRAAMLAGLPDITQDGHRP